MNLKELIRDLPSDPGIYQMMDGDHKIIYIGKAKNIKKRVSSYFLKGQKDIKTAILVSQICTIETIVTQSEKDALILENQLIKTLKPKYNIALKDDKNYPYIKLSVKDPFPKIEIVRDRSDNRAQYWGPYPSVGSSRKLEKLIYELFPIRDCSQTIDLIKIQPKCLNLDMQKCIGPCLYKEIKPEYDQLIENLQLFLSGKNQELIRRLQVEMESLSTQLRFEKAAAIRDKIQKIKKLQERQWVRFSNISNAQIWTYAQNDRLHYVLVQHIIEGKLLFQNGFYLEKKDAQNPADFISQTILTQWSKNSDGIEIICSEDIVEIFLKLKNLLQEEKIVIKINQPQRGEKKGLLQIAKRNGELALHRLELQFQKQELKKGNSEILTEMKKIFRLTRFPKLIVGFDISHLNGTEIVASAVSFKDGEKYSDGYRHYKIRSVTQKSDDVRSIYEVVVRRLTAAQNGEEEMPDLILIDGGKPQLSFALSALKEAGVETQDILALAKKKELLFLPDQSRPMRLPYHHECLKLLQRIRDEAHRFSVTFQRNRRKKIQLKSILSDIYGLGPKRIRLLYQTYQTIENMAHASVDELAEIGKMGRDLARKVLERLSK